MVQVFPSQYDDNCEGFLTNGYCDAVPASLWLHPACSCPIDQQHRYTDVTPAEANTLIDTHTNLVIIDVSPYYDRGHLPGAVSIPVSNLSSRLPELDKKRPSLVYCHGDAPSIQGATMLVNAGFSPVYRLKGNYAAWVSAGYQVEM